MKLIEVVDKTTKKQFLDVPKILYKDDKNWICPLDVEIEGIFNPATNGCFEFGEAIRWILIDDNGNLVGRVAAFYDKRKINHCYVPSGNIGFFECVNNQSYANLLFDKSKEWLQTKGIEAMDGNTNFGENLFHWGVLVEGFEPMEIGMQYNPPYYQQLFENYGFKEYFQQRTNHLDLTKPIPARFGKIADWVLRKKEFNYRHFDFRQSERFLADFKTVNILLLPTKTNI